MRFEDITISSLTEMLAALRETGCDGSIVWFRGQSNREWALAPSLSRLANGTAGEIALMKRFKQNALPLASVRPSSEWEWLFLMQHYGLPTRLLDWTESPLTALFFAVENPDAATDAALWCLSPVDLNANAGISYDVSVEIPCFEVDDVLNNYLPQTIEKERTSKLNPIAAMAIRDNPRVFAQLGTFTITHREQTPIDSVGDGKHIWRFIIPADAKENFRQELVFLRITRMTLFPELQNVALLAREVFA